MNWDIVAGSWKQFAGKTKARWSKFTDDQSGMVSGRRIELAGRIQENYGIARNEAELQFRRFKELNKDYRSNGLPEKGQSVGTVR